MHGADTSLRLPISSSSRYSGKLSSIDRVPGKPLSMMSGKRVFNPGGPTMVSGRVAFGDVIGLEKEERQAGDVIGVKMRDENDFDVIAVDRKLVHGDERGRAAIDQRVDLVADEMEAGVESSAGAEGITAADELQVHGMSPRSPTRQFLVRLGAPICGHRHTQCRVKAA